MILCLLMIGRMLLGRAEKPAQSTPPSQTQPAPQEQQPAPPKTDKEFQMEMQLSENDLNTLIAQALPFPLEQISTTIREDGTICFRASAKKQSLIDSGVAAGNLRTVLLFLPDPCSVYTVWRADVQDGTLALRCDTMEVAGLALPQDAAEKVSDLIGTQLNDQLTQWGIAPRAIRFENGAISIGT